MIWGLQYRAAVYKIELQCQFPFRVLASDPDTETIWAGTQQGVVSQLQLIAQRTQAGITYTMDLAQTLQLAAASCTDHVPLTTATTNPQSAQLTSPFLQPRRTQSLFAPDDHLPEQASQSASDIDRPAILEGMLSDGEVPLGQVHSASEKQTLRAQLLPREPILPTPSIAIRVSNLTSPAQGFPDDSVQVPEIPPSRAHADVIHPQSLHRSGSANSAQLPRQAQEHTTSWTRRQDSGMPPTSAVIGRQRSGQLPPAGIGQRQLSGHLQLAALSRRRSCGQLPKLEASQPNIAGPQGANLGLRQGSGRSHIAAQMADDSSFAASQPASTSGCISQEGPVHAIAIAHNRVFTSTSFPPQAAFREWTTDGQLLVSHRCCSLGESSL